MTVLFFTDGYTDRPPSNNPRAMLEYELGRLKALLWCDPGDGDVRTRIAAVEAKLATLNRNGGGA
jgi:hypothetical protein